jgi:vacuolar protein sorting-associated protein 72
MPHSEASDIPMTDTPPQDEPHSDGDEPSLSSEDEPAMVVTRERRQNAGNRMSRLLELAEAEGQQEEEYGEIFQEAADDVEFEGDDGNEDDFNMDSSSEDEAEGQDDDEQGEKELRKEIRTQSKKRKRDSLLQHAMKRAAIRVAPVPLGASQPAISEAQRPRKKSERVSWLPEPESGPVRSSRRQLAVQNKQEIHERLKEKEKHRLRTVEVMKAAEARKEASKPKILTQEERLKEAAQIERKNSKSLNRWETNEKRRAAEQAARLAALKDRKLEGPIITYWSGQSTWVDGKLKSVGKSPLVQEADKEKAKSMASEKKDVAQISEPAAPIQASPVQAPSVQAPSVQIPSVQGPTGQEPAVQAPTVPSSNGVSQVEGPKTEQQASSPAPSQGLGNFLDGINVYAELPAEEQPQSQPPKIPSPISVPHPKPKPGPPQLATRNFIVLADFDPPLRQKDPDVIRHHLFSWPIPTSTTAAATKKLLPSKKSHCAITGQEARYRDPVTGLGYVDAYALKRIRRVVRGKMVWSALLGGFVGERYDKDGPVGSVRPAKGVPERFHNCGGQSEL